MADVKEQSSPLGGPRLSGASKRADATDAREIRAKHREFLFPCVANYYEEPIVLTKGKGSWAYDADGRVYLDFFGGILTLGLGHCHPEVVTRVQEQIETLGHTSTLYPTANAVHVAERLAKMTPGKLKKSLFTTPASRRSSHCVTATRAAVSWRNRSPGTRHGGSCRRRCPA
jgi:alanine-glyoxylate transaminase / (R)-3-amino-2-methylpropionate-pyruvate transaminase